MTYNKPFYAVWRGLRGAEIALGEWGAVNYMNLLETLERVGNMERGQSQYYSFGTMVGFVSHESAEAARSWAHDTHESQEPDAYEVTRTSRGWRVESIY